MSRKPSLLTVVRQALVFVILICIAVMLEFFVSNYRNLFIDPSDYETNVNPLNGEPVLLQKDETATIKIDSVPDKLFAIRIRSIAVQNAEFTKPVKVVVKGYDARRSATFATLITDYLAPGSEKILYFDCTLAQPVLEFTFSDVTASGEITSVTVNPAGALRSFNYVRCFFLLALELILWLGSLFKLGRTPFDPSKLSHVAAVSFSLAVCILMTSVFCAVFVGKGENVAYPLEKGVNTYNPYIQQTDAFLKGQLHIDYPVPDKLLELENPYDYDSRKGIVYLWDRAMYDGKYYSYFGVAPILNLYLPQYYLTDTLPSDETVVAFYTMMTVLFSTLFVVAYVVLYKKKVPVSLLCLGLLALVFSSNVLLMARGVQRFYYIAILAGMAYLAAFLFFLLLAVRCRNRVGRPLLFLLAGLSYAMLFLSRLNMALLAAFIVLPVLFFAILLRRNKMDADEGSVIRGDPGAEDEYESRTVLREQDLLDGGLLLEAVDTDDAEALTAAPLLDSLDELVEEVEETALTEAALLDEEPTASAEAEASDGEAPESLPLLSEEGSPFAAVSEAPSLTEDVGEPSAEDGDGLPSFAPLRIVEEEELPAEEKAKRPPMSEKAKRILSTVTDLGALALFVVLAFAFTLWYNNARFGSPLEFGTNYQLTVSDVSQNKLSLDGIPAAIYHYFLQPLNISGTFPFFSFRYSNLYDYGSYVYVDTGMGLFSIPLMLGCLLAFPAVFNKKKTPFARSLSALFLVGLLLIAVMNFCLGGVIFRYTSDMTLLAALASLLLLFSFHEEHVASGGNGTACRFAIAGLMLASILVCFSLLVSVNGNLAVYDASIFVRIAEFFGI